MLIFLELYPVVSHLEPNFLELGCDLVNFIVVVLLNLLQDYRLFVVSLDLDLKTLFDLLIVLQ